MIDEPVTTAAAASDLLSKLVAIPSVAPDVPGGTGESAMAEAVEAFARDVGATVACCEALPGRSNVVATLPGAAARPALMLEAHMDTVALGPMTNGHHPWVDALGRLHGRGACDTKGALAAMLLALQWAAHQPQRPCTLVLAAAVDEETGGHGARALARSGPPADAAIVGEPTGLTIVRAHRGVVIWTLVTAGAAAHSSTPERGHNAIYDMCEVVGILRAEYAGRLAGRSHPLTGPSTFSAGVIRAGTSFNIIPDRCELVIERRNIPGESLSAVEAELEDVLEVVRTRLPHARVALAASEVLAASLHTPPEAPIVRAARAAAEAVTGRGVLAGAPYGSDAAWLQAGGIPGVLLGPGDIAYAHGADEWVPIAEVVQAAQIYAEAWQRLPGALASAHP